MTELFELSMTSAIRSLEGNRIKEMLLSRPDLIRRLDPNLIFSPGEGNPPSVRIDTTLPPLPEAVDPGDLIRAEDWNALLARLTALEPVLANLADAAVSLATRVARPRAQARRHPRAAEGQAGSARHPRPRARRPGARRDDRVEAGPRREDPR